MARVLKSDFACWLFCLRLMVYFNPCHCDGNRAPDEGCGFITELSSLSIGWFLINPSNTASWTTHCRYRYCHFQVGVAGKSSHELLQFIKFKPLSVLPAQRHESLCFQEVPLISEELFTYKLQLNQLKQREVKKVIITEKLRGCKKNHVRLRTSQWEKIKNVQR